MDQWFMSALMGKEAGDHQKTGPGPPSLGFSRKVRRKVSQSTKPVEEKFCRIPKVLQNFGSQTLLFSRKCPDVYKIACP